MKIQKNKLHILSGTAERDLGRNTFDMYIGIDPDIYENGIAIYSKKNKSLIRCNSINFWGLFKDLSKIKDTQFDYIIHIEGGWLNEKSNWHAEGQSKAAGEKIAKNVGANQQTGKLIVEMCIHLDISFLVRQPIPPRFADAEFFKKVTGWVGRTNHDARSAANYVYGY